jgi:hypothetical protein
MLRIHVDRNAAQLTVQDVRDHEQHCYGEGELMDRRTSPR